MNIQKLIFLVSLFLSILTPQFILSQPPGGEELRMEVESKTEEPKPMEIDDPALTGKKQDPILLLPKTAIMKILSELTTEELLKKAATSKDWKKKIYDWKVWKQKTIKIVGVIGNSDSADYSLSNINEAHKILAFLQKIKNEKEVAKNKIDKKLNPVPEASRIIKSLTLQKRKIEIKEQLSKKQKVDPETIKTLEKEKDQLLTEIDEIKNSITFLLIYFNSPQTIINKSLNLTDENQIKLPDVSGDVSCETLVKREVPGAKTDDLPEGEQPAWTESEIQINWRDEWANLNEQWSSLQKQETISVANLNNQLFAKLLIVAIAYLNKSNGQINIDQIQGNDLFKAALLLLSSRDDKYQKIRRRLRLNNEIDLLNTQITNEDLPFICFFLNKFNKTIPIKWLRLSNNQIKEIQPETLEGLEKLEWLWLENNQIQIIQSRAFEGLEKLEYLYLSSNQIKEIQSGTFKGLEKLEWLSLSSNQIKVIQSGTFKGLEKLEWLYLSSNQIEEIQPGTFKGLEKLEYLSLSSNQIQIIQSGTFKGLVKLKYLSLSSNQIKVIQSGTFEGLGNLENLYLDNNQLTTLPENLYQVLPKIKKIFIKNAGLNSQAIEIPIEESARNDFASRLYTSYYTPAREGVDYVFVDPRPVAMEVD